MKIRNKLKNSINGKQFARMKASTLTPAYQEADSVSDFSNQESVPVLSGPVHI
jgi:hypothetical protein